MKNSAPSKAQPAPDPKVVRSECPNNITAPPIPPRTCTLLRPQDLREGRHHRLSANVASASRTSSTSRLPATSRKIVASDSTMSAAIKSAVNLRLREVDMGHRTVSATRPISAMPSTKRASTDHHNTTAPKSPQSSKEVTEVNPSRLHQQRMSHSRPIASVMQPRCPPPPYVVRITKVVVFEAVDASVSRVRSTVSPPRGKHDID